MTLPVQYSDDQAEAWDAITELLRGAGVDLVEGTTAPAVEKAKPAVLAVMGKAGSGKTLLLAELVKSLRELGLETVSGDWESRKRGEKRTLAILAPTNKAASVLRNRGVPATTIHRIIYTPVYDPEYEKIAEWLAGEGDRPTIEGLTEDALDRAHAFYQQQPSVPGALAAAGLRGSDFITGWKRRDDPLDIGFVDESSMLDDKQMDDLREIFSTLVLFGDPAQLAPVGQSGSMVFDALPDSRKRMLDRVHRQAADSPILDLAHALGDPALQFEDFERMIEQAAARETLEEACARVRDLSLYTLFDLPHISQVYMMFRAELVDLDFAVGEESLEVRLFAESEIPWSELAFPTIGRTLECFFADRRQNLFPVRNEPLEALRAHYTPR